MEERTFEDKYFLLHWVKILISIVAYAKYTYQPASFQIPTQVTEGLPIEPVRHYRAGGYSWGDMANVAKDVPEAIKKYYNLNK